MSTVGDLNYAGYLLHHMVEAEPNHEYVLLSNRPPPAALLPRAARLAAQPFPSRALWMQLALPRRLRGLNLDIRSGELPAFDLDA